MITNQQISPEEYDELRIQLQVKVWTLAKKIKHIETDIENKRHRSMMLQAAKKALHYHINTAKQILEVLQQDPAHQTLVTEQESIIEKYKQQLKKLPNFSKRIPLPTELIQLEMKKNDLKIKQQLYLERLSEMDAQLGT